MLWLTYLSAFLQAYRCLFVLLGGTISMYYEIDSDPRFQGFLQTNKYLVVPFCDFVTALATLYLFKCLSDKTRQLQRQAGPFVLSKKKDKYNTKDLNDLLHMRDLDQSSEERRPKKSSSSSSSSGEESTLAPLKVKEGGLEG